MTTDTDATPIMTIAIRTTICTAIAVLIAWMALVPDQPTILWIDKLDHVAAFGALATVMRLARVRTSIVLWTCFAAAAGIELAQGAFPSLRREMSAMDLLASWAGATAAVVTICGAARILRTHAAGRGQRPEAREALSAASR